MGMFNEVFDNCPDCGRHTGYLQIRQIVLGFGNFDLADLAWLKVRHDRGDFSTSELNQLADELEDTDSIFRCRTDDDSAHHCHKSWRADPAKILAIRMLTQIDVDDTRERALRMLEEAGILKSQ